MKTIFAVSLSLFMLSFPNALFGATEDAFSGIHGNTNSLSTEEINAVLNQGGESFAIDGFGGFDAVGSLGQACGGSATGGAVSNALSGSNVLQSILGGGSGKGSSLITCISGGASCPGGASGSIPGLSGLSGSSVNALINVIGGGNVAQSIIGLAGQNAGSILSALGLSGGGGSAVGNAVSGVLGGSGVGGIAGGALGSVLGGGSAVPTNEKNPKLLENIRNTDASTAALKHKETCTDTIAYNLAQQTEDSLNARTREFLNTGNAGEPFQVTNYQQLYSRVSDSVTADYINAITKELPDSKISNTVAELLADDYAAEKNPIAAFQGCDGPENESSLLRFKRLIVDHPGCTTQGGYVTATNYLFDKRAGAKNAVEQAVSDGQGTLPKATAKINGVETPVNIADSAVNYKIVVPGANIAQEGFRIDAAGAERLQKVNEAGQVVNQFMVQFFQQALTNIGGLLSLSERGSGTVGAGGPPRVTPIGNDAGGGVGNTAGGGTSTNDDGFGATGDTGITGDTNDDSYLDQLANTGTSVSIDSGRGLLTQSIRSAMNTEEAYQQILGIMVDDLGIAGGAFDQVRQCYVGLTNRVSTGISTASALEKANQASSTVAAIFIPQIERRLAEIANSELVMGELVRLNGLARDATSAEEVNAVSDSFDALLSSGLVHSDTDVSFLENDRAAAAVALDQVANEAFAQLSECRQF